MLISPREPVALFVSAWIEIYLDKSTNRSPFVALFVSAWIEIHPITININVNGSRTLCECVDWNCNVWVLANLVSGRTLCECVDWNEYCFKKSMSNTRSHSLWVRGLKWSIKKQIAKPAMSHSLWVRGLKSGKRSGGIYFFESHSLWVRGLK